MRQINMKIRPQFLPNIRNGKKKHEYRLASPKYKDLNIGDVICLINNQNPNDFVKVMIDKITKYNNLEEAFNGRWKDDFDGVYSNYDDLINECSKFYKAFEIKEYGIQVFDIRLIKNKNVRKAKFLFDTNIIIQRDKQSNVNDIIGIMFNEIDKIQGKLFYHSKTRYYF